MTQLRRIGILGGMGPQATVLLMQKLIDSVPAEDDADHIPLIVDNNTQVPSRIRCLIDGTGEDPGPVLAEMAQRLEESGAEALAMPCNTAHHYAPQIEAAATVPFLDMVAASAAAARRAAGPGGKVGVLASPAVQKIGIFETALGRLGLTTDYPEHQEAMLAAIRSIKHAGDTPEARQSLRSGSAELLARGARVQLIACTEFSVIADAVAPQAIALDTLDVLVEQILGFARGAAERGEDQRRAG